MNSTDTHIAKKIKSIIPRSIVIKSYGQEILVDRHGEIFGRIEGSKVILYKEYTFHDLVNLFIKEFGVNTSISQTPAIDDLPFIENMKINPKY